MAGHGAKVGNLRRSNPGRLAFRRIPQTHQTQSAYEGGKERSRVFERRLSAADQSLRELSRITGGRVYFPKNQKEFNRACAEIAQLIRHEYSLAFAPPAH